jgi:short chain dehydrogenase
MEEGRKMTGLLAERIAVVTGGGSGIGRAIALGYAREGAQVAVLDVNGAAAAETVKAITGAGGKAYSFTLDVTERDTDRREDRPGFDPGQQCWYQSAASMRALQPAAGLHDPVVSSRWLRSGPVELPAKAGVMVWIGRAAADPKSYGVAD